MNQDNSNNTFYKTQNLLNGNINCAKLFIKIAQKKDIWPMNLCKKNMKLRIV